MKFLLDTGTSKNYLKPVEGLFSVIPVNKKFSVKSIHGSSVIDSKCQLSMFGSDAPFFFLDALDAFDGIIGNDLLKAVDASIHLGKEKLDTSHGTEPIHFLECSRVNFCEEKDICSPVPENVKERFRRVLAENKTVFADPKEALPFNTNIVGTIRTTDEEPVYSKLYPYPISMTDFVNKEIAEMLRMGIIRKSRSPYNNPVWIVDKKGINEEGIQNKRFVNDFRKLNEKTIDDKYPVPDITTILSNLGKAKYFTKLDLKSGFYQIVLAEKDREKTAFSVNNGKYEYCRLPFGLKNAPSIFQRAIDDILRENIGIFIFVYVDDIIIYSINQEDHIKHIEWTLKALLEANMRVSAKKSEFFKTSVEYLGFIVSREGVRTCPDKVEAILKFTEPKTLFEVRSFLGLSGYYRRFIKNFASIAKSLNELLKGDNGKVSANKSKRVRIELNEEQRQAFLKLRQVLSSEDVILLYPDFSKPFELTTDASQYGMGAVLSQDGRPIMMISKTLSEKQQEFATNERELLAIVWALKRLRNFLYGTKNIQIFTDHQPLTFSISDKNTNAKIKRWKAFIEEHNAKIFYKPGKDNIVADALSRQVVNALDNVSTTATVNSEESSTRVILKTDSPVNCYMNQIVVEESDEPSTKTVILFRNKRRHVVRYNDIDGVIEQVKAVVNLKAVNAIHCDLHVLGSIQDNLVESFPTTRFRFAPNFVIDITNRDEQREIIVTEHSRAHRGAQNVKDTILRDYYFPRMGRLTAEAIANCRVCRENKYVRHPVRHVMGETPIPSRPGERIHIDILSTDRKNFLTCVDKFSKFSLVIPIASRGIVDVLPAILQVINRYPQIKYVYCDNEASFSSFSIRELLDRFGIELSTCPPDHSTSNGQVERLHSTLEEIARCLRAERHISDTVELILLANIEYNNTIHSVTGEKPIDILHTHAMRKNTKARLIKAQGNLLRRYNRGRSRRSFNVGDIVYVRISRRRGNKLSIKRLRRKIQADLGTTVLIRGKIVHKDNIL